MAKKKKEMSIWKPIGLIILVIWIVGFAFGNFFTIFNHSYENCHSGWGVKYIFLNFPCIMAEFTFNPDTDVCLEVDWYCQVQRDTFEKGTKNYNIMNKNCEYLFCEEWRPKNQCELDPEAEGCICDEYQLDGSEVIVCDIKHRDTNPHLINECSNVGGKIENGCCYPCIKSHLPNECESENPDYKLETKCFASSGYGVNCTLGRDNVTICDQAWNCTDEREICRKKTLKDILNELRKLDCAQLENELCCNLGINCNIDWDYYVSEQFLNYQRADYLLFMNDYVFYILEEKGCQI